MIAKHYLPYLLGLLVTFTATAQDEPESKPTSKPVAESAETEADDEKDAEADEDADTFIVIRGADVYTGTGTRLRRATIVIKNDTIESVGHDVEIPENATEIDASGRAVSPGFISIGSSGFGAPSAFRLEEIEDSLNPFDPSIKLGLAAGITSFGMLSSGGRDTPRGKSAVIKLAPGDLEGMLCATNTFVSMRTPLDRKQWRTFRELVEKAREHLAAVEKAANEKPDPKAEQGDEKAKAPTGKGRSAAGSKGGPKPPRGTEVILDILAGKKRLWIDLGNAGGGWFMGAPSNSDNEKVRQGIEIAELLGQGVVFDRPITGWVYADQIARTGSMAIIAPRKRVTPDEGNPDITGSNFASAAILDKVGVPVAVMPPTSNLTLMGLYGQDVNTLHVEAAFAVRGGLDNRKALRTITLDAAKILGVDDKTGSIEPGKDADLLILTGDPLHYASLVDTAIVNGKVVYERRKESFYSHISR